MRPFVFGSLSTLAVIVLSEVVYKLFTSWRQHRRPRDSESESKDKRDIMEVLFFPDKEVACKTHFLSDTRCFKRNCKYSHGKTSLSELYRHLSSCRKTMDVCVFVMTCEELVGIVLSMHHRGVKVRVITDDEQETIDGSRIWSLRKAGTHLLQSKLSRSIWSAFTSFSVHRDFGIHGFLGVRVGACARVHVCVRVRVCVPVLHACTWPQKIKMAILNWATTSWSRFLKPSSK